MPSLGNKKYMSPKQYAEWQKTWYGRYSTALKKHHFLLFGLPFFATLFFGSIYLSEFTQVKYTNYDNKVRMMDEEEALSIGRNKRKVNMKDEFYVSILFFSFFNNNNNNNNKANTNKKNSDYNNWEI